MARFRVLFDGMLCGSQTSTTPSPFIRHFLAPAVRRDGLRAAQAPLGLRRVEAALLQGGWDPADVAVVRPEELRVAIGPRTRLIGISSGDPLGRGMNSTTMAGIAGGKPHTSLYFQRLSRRVAALRARAGDARVVLGGPGAWQLAANGNACRLLGVDHVVTGYCEGNVAELFARLADGESLPPLLEGRPVAAGAVPPIRGPAVLGSVEVSRGCGMGCGFCTLAHTPMDHLSPQTILADAQTNLAGGADSIALVTEDVFRYGARGRRANPEALIGLVRQVRSLSGLRLIQTDHANIVSVAQFTDDELAELRRQFVGERRRHDYLWVNLGVETAAGQLLADNGGRAKMLPHAIEEWPDLCHEQVRRLARAGFFPLVSLVLGLPGETEGDIQTTTAWVEQLRHERVAVFPMFHAPLDAGAPGFGVADMTAAHWRLFRACYRLNFRWVPRLVWDNQRGAGVGLARRLPLQMLGRLQALWWKILFAWRSGTLR